MKHIHMMAFGLLLALFLCGCREQKQTAAAQAQSSSVSTEFKTAEELIAEAEAKEQEESLVQAELTFGQAAGTYRCVSTEISDQYWPNIELTSTGQAVFHANLLTGMGEAKGTYTIDGDRIHVTVEQVSFTGFTGENVTDMMFDRISEDTLELAYTTPDSPIGLTNAGDRFVKAAQ